MRRELGGRHTGLRTQITGRFSFTGRRRLFFNRFLRSSLLLVFFFLDNNRLFIDSKLYRTLAEE